MKERLNQIYHDILLTQGNPDQPNIIPLIKAILDNINNPSLLGSLLKATIKTLIKLLTFEQVTEHLNKSSEFDTQLLVLSILEAKFDTIDQSEEEQMLLLIQKTLLTIVKTLNLNEDYQFRVFKYFMRILKKKSLEDADSNYSLQFVDLTKKNLHKLLYHFMSEDEEHQVKQKIFKNIFTKIIKTLQKLEKKPVFSNKLREYACFHIKTLEDCFRKITTSDELRTIIIDLRPTIIEIVCKGAEFDDITIRNQSQQLFTLVLTAILENNIPMREELELLLVKVALKPALLYAKKLGQTQELAKSSSTDANSKANSNANSQNLNESDYENDDFIQINHEKTTLDDLVLEMNFNYLLETLLLLTPEQLSQLFLMYDCQPFSENFISKSLLLILKVAQKNPHQYLAVFNKIITRFSQFSINIESVMGRNNGGGPQMISYMLEQKVQARKLVKDANHKFKIFLQKIEEMYAYVDAQTPHEVASKILVYSRELQIDKVAEIIGGKDEKAKRLLVSYLNKMDYKECDIEQSLRKFLQTFRLAGVDSQVVLRILELFSHKFHENDKNSIFITKEEAYEFAYLIIVLQTCQHNPSVKNKTDLKSFQEGAMNICPKSKDTIPDTYVEKTYNSITNNAFYTPVSRSLIEEGFNPYNLNECEIRLSKCNDIERPLTENEFINSADLTQKQLFHYSNTTVVPQTLIPQAAKHLLVFLTQKFIRYNLQLPVPQIQNAETMEIVNRRVTILRQLANLNKSFYNYDIVDKLFQVMYRAIQHTLNNDKLHTELEAMVWDNFECIKRSLVLLPKLSIQSFMKDEIKTSIREAFKSVQRLALFKQQERKKVKHANLGGTGKAGAQGQQPLPARSQSFFDLVYNYFTDNNEEESKDDKDDQFENESIISIRKRLLMEDKEGDYMEYIEEKFDEKIGKQSIKEKSRLNELITLICQCVKENFNQEEGILCLAFLNHLIGRSENSLETIEKIWVELHLLLNSCLKSKPLDPLTLQLSLSSSSKEEKKQEYEVVSTDTSQDSIDSSAHISPEMDLFTKDNCQVKTKINEAVVRHLILGLHLKISKQVILMKQENHHVIRDLQRLISFIIEGDPVDKNQDGYQLFDDLGLFQMLSTMIQTEVSFKSYPKISKLLRLMLILILKSLTRKIDTDDLNNELLLQKLKFFCGITHYLQELSSSLPYDQISLALDIFQKLQLPQTKCPQSEKILELSIQIIDNLGLALSKQILINDESKLEIWFRMIQILQEKVLFNPTTKKYEVIPIQGFNVMKNLVLNHPFHINESNFKFIRKLFADVLFWQTFENLSLEHEEVKDQQKPVGQKQQEEVKKSPLQSKPQKKDNEDDEDMMETSLEQICQIAICNLSDIFIYYIDLIFRDPYAQVHSTEANNDEEESSAKLFTYLWLNLLKVMLHFAEKANLSDLDGLVHSVHDNVKRVLEFLIQQGILIENSKNGEMAKLQKTTWEIVLAFFPEMKTQVIGVPQSQDKK